MGLLDELLGQLTAGAAAPNADPRAARTQASSGMGSSTILMTLLPVVLGMLQNRGEPSAGAGRASAGGGLGGILGQVLGGAAGGGGLGGLGAILDQFQRAGYGQQASSWVSTGQNLPLPPGALEQVFGGGGLAEIARRAGLSQEDTSRGLAQLMPEVVDHVTPGGKVPDGSDLLANVEALGRRFGC